MSSSKNKVEEELSTQSWQLVYNLWMYFEEDRHNEDLLVSINKVVQRVAAALKIGERTITILEEKIACKT